MVKERNNSVDLLRIVAMLMIIIGHAILHSEIEGISCNAIDNCLITLLRIICYPAVNIFVLITGYFSLESNFKSKKALLPWIETTFYAVIIYAAVTIGGGYDFSFIELIKSFLPLSGNILWFIRVYLVLYILSPFLNVLIRNLSKEQYKLLLLIGFVLLSLWRSFIPFATTINVEGGNSIIWFCYLYFVGAYLRKYPLSLKPKHSLLLSLLLLTMAYCSYYLISLISTYIGFAGKGSSLFTEYTSFTIFGASVLLLNCAVKANNISNTFIIKAITFVKPSVFGVILIHGNQWVRWKLWPLLKQNLFIGEFITVKIIIASTVIYIVCVFIDKVLWGNVLKIIEKMHLPIIEKVMNKWDSIVNKCV